MKTRKILFTWAKILFMYKGQSYFVIPLGEKISFALIVSDEIASMSFTIVIVVSPWIDFFHRIDRQIKLPIRDKVRVLFQDARTHSPDR